MATLKENNPSFNFDFLPQTYVLPEQYSDFVHKFSHYQKKIAVDFDFSQKRNLWIVKPANLSRGRGIYIIDDVSEVNLDDTAIISKYVEDPLLINNHKFDLRIYVCVTSYEPLRIYVYKEGLVRFASEKYSLRDAKSNLFKHLTNYSINKKNTNFVKNEDADHDDVGFKWSLQAFMKHLKTYKQVDIDLLWSRIYDLIIKSILCGENHVYSSVKKLSLHRNNCFEVFGYDVLLDSQFKPWLMEINLSPSLACDSPLDMEIKARLITDTFNLIGIKKFDRKKEHENKAKNRMKSYNRSKEISKQFNNILNKEPSLNNIFTIGNVNSKQQKNGQQMADLYHDDFSQPINKDLLEQIHILLEQEPEYLDREGILKKLATTKYKEVLREVLAESSRSHNFIRIYPQKSTNAYDSLFQQQRPMNRYIYKMLFTQYLDLTRQEDLTDFTNQPL